MIKFTFPRELRLLTPFDFNYVFQESVRAGSPFLTLVARKNTLNHCRLGFAIAKKQIKRSHERNRIKRLAKEYFRHHQHQFPNIDFILMAKSPAIELDNQKLVATLEKLCQRIIEKQSV
ncbi:MULTISPECIES: ribonuclease P protein component [unclassified Gilliamella]|uniref:ribonuclease P protein component n=1 Tax=unclassified Gilliamella TaxID=2685620 RepID=UPI00226AD1BE|nr:MULTISPECIES: ribonuclease P protein component [unclassified Gilliamella]MCX8642078.1 ribonuclease P protein component [Gilliamella sp. B3835]MCX8707264.1 ribonuclease P protein component [Gilliamella sp. B3783]MCX8710827.1 ribonuclease P protein component [Gilliamella sp. B3780]MCX8711828.1 ribonuclease P protein component [Gilliamella sp. B3468]MCX8713995.1 ribonuclease P protein component [Gilliamella sp. B3781]